MPRIRNGMLALVLTALATQPVLAETCSLTVNGRPILDDEPCTSARTRGGMVTVRPEAAGRVVIRRSILMTDLAGEANRKGSRRRSRLRSFGLVVRSDSLNDKVCYFNQQVTLCIDE